MVAGLVALVVHLGFLVALGYSSFGVGSAIPGRPLIGVYSVLVLVSPVIGFLWRRSHPLLSSLFILLFAGGVIQGFLLIGAEQGWLGILGYAVGSFRCSVWINAGLDPHCFFPFPPPIVLE